MSMDGANGRGDAGATMPRRRAIQTLAVSMAALPALARMKADPEPIFKISLAQWSLHRGLKDGSIDHLDFAAISNREFDIQAIEFVNSFFKDKARDAAYLKEMNLRAADNGVYQNLIMIDGEGALGHPDETERAKAIDNHKRWVEAAKVLECRSIRVNAQSQGTWDEQMDRAADGLARLTQFAEPFGINVIVENHGGYSSNGQWLAGVMKKVGLPTCGTLPDFGNFHLGGGKQYDRYKGVFELMPFAKAVSAKAHDFDADGNETHTDYRRMMKIVVDAGYHDFVGIEYEGGKLDEFAGIRATKALLEKVRGEMAGG
jgi:L-ribulose-5-phosphate 3-epimerase